MGELGKVVEELRKLLRPTSEELARAYRFYELIKEVVESTLRLDVPFKVELVGSLAKGTALRDDIDLDIFVLIDKKDLTRDWLLSNFVEPLKSALSRVGIIKLRYAAHPYIHITNESISADVVPAYWARSPSDIVTSVDRTPFHKEFVLRNLKEEQKDDVRVLKKFFKVTGIYGAEIKVGGFSGYLCELLVIKYGNFEEVLRNMARWRYGEVIKIGGEVDVNEARNLRRFFDYPPLIVLDPIDPNRNVAAAVTIKSFSTAILASNMFLRCPSKDLFLRETTFTDLRDLSRVLEETGREVGGFVITHDEVSPDILWGKLRRLAKVIENKLQEGGFSVLETAIWSNETNTSVMIFDIHPKKLGYFKFHVGPKVTDHNNMMKFLIKYLKASEGVYGPWLDSTGRLYVLRKRPVTRLREALTLLEGEIKWPDYFKEVKVFEGITEISELLRSDPEFNRVVTDVVLKSPHWLRLLKPR